jgi:hypothetical protein
LNYLHNSAKISNNNNANRNLLEKSSRSSEKISKGLPPKNQKYAKGIKAGNLAAKPAEETVGEFKTFQMIQNNKMGNKAQFNHKITINIIHLTLRTR